MFFAEDEGAETVNRRSVFPIVGSQAGFSARLLKERFPVPRVCSRNLRQKQTSITPLADKKSVLSDFDFADVLDASHGGEHGDFKVDQEKLVARQWNESRVTDGRRNRAFCRAAVQRSGRLNVADAAPQFAMLVNGNKDPAGFVQSATRVLGCGEGFARQISSNGIPSDPKQQMLIALSELEHLGSGHDDSAFSVEG